jgi:hypothetical protein
MSRAIDVGCAINLLKFDRVSVVMALSVVRLWRRGGSDGRRGSWEQVPPPPAQVPQSQAYNCNANVELLVVYGSARQC